jgi:drug/metabolite transporter (DMT)-like permease
VVLWANLTCFGPTGATTSAIAVASWRRTRHSELVFGQGIEFVGFGNNSEESAKSGRLAGSVADFSIVQGIILVIAVAFLWSASDTASQVLTHDLPALEVTFFRYAVHVSVLFPWLRGGLKKAWKTNYLRAQVLRGVFSASSAICFIIGLNYIPVADATAVTFIQPLAIIAFAAVLIREKVDNSRWIAACIGLCGVLIIVQPGGDAFRSSALLPLLAALFSALALVTTRMMPSDDPKVTMVYTGFSGLVLLGASMPAVWVSPSLWDFVVAIIGGLFGACAQVIQITIYRRYPSSILAPFSYSQLLWASIIGFLVFGIWPTATTMLGASLIVVGGLYSAWAERRHQTATD